ncbi:MAG: sugar phosphate nucleotidyltransferase [Spartobacteria bacterium]
MSQEKRPVTQAFVLGAGLGTRLRPLTEDLPKPLVPIFQKPLITFALDQLVDIGVTKFLINTHHRSERFSETFARSSYRNHGLQFFHEPDLLETAGGIANIAAAIAREPLLIYNGDILSDLPLAPLIETHVRNGNMVTLALRSNAEPKQVAFDSSSGRIIDIRNELGTGARDEFVFTGIYIVDPTFVDLLERGVKRSVIPHFLDLMRRKEKIGGVVIDDGHWWDVGNRDAYLQLHRELPSLNFPAYPVPDPKWKMSIHPSAMVDSTAQVRGCSVVGRDCRVEADAILEDTIVWPGAQITSRSKLYGCIVRSHRKVEGTHRKIDI